MEQHVQLQFTVMNNDYVVIIITILYVCTHNDNLCKLKIVIIDQNAKIIVNMCTMYKWYVLHTM